MTRLMGCNQKQLYFVSHYSNNIIQWGEVLPLTLDKTLAVQRFSTHSSVVKSPEATLSHKHSLHWIIRNTHGPCNKQSFQLHSQLEELLSSPMTGCRPALWLPFLPSPPSPVVVFDAARAWKGGRKRAKMGLFSWYCCTVSLGFKSGSSSHGLLTSFKEPHWEPAVTLPKVWMIWDLDEAFSSAWLFPYQPFMGLPQLGLDVCQIIDLCASQTPGDP